MTYEIVYEFEKKKQKLTVFSEQLISTLMKVTSKGYVLHSVKLIA